MKRAWQLFFEGFCSALGFGLGAIIVLPVLYVYFHWLGWY